MPAAGSDVMITFDRLFAGVSFASVYPKSEDENV